MHRTCLAVAALVIFAGSVPSFAQTPQPLDQHHHHHAFAHRPLDPCASLPSRWQRAECFDYHHSAPGDEYFGRMKMSYLGIDNTAHDVAIEAGAYTTDPGLIARIRFADEALREWEHRYPGDPQLARSYFLMVRALRKIYTPQAQQRAWQYMQHIVRVYPASYFAKVMRGEIARGFTEHWFALAQACPTPMPTLGPHERATPSPPPTPEPAATDTPTPAPSGQPNIDIITPPCVQPEPTP